MNFLTIIYMVGVAALGFILGIITELALDAKTIRDYQAENNKLRLENQQLKNEAKAKEQAEVIQILDYRQRQTGTYFQPF